MNGKRSAAKEQQTRPAAKGTATISRETISSKMNGKRSTGKRLATNSNSDDRQGNDQ